MQFFRKRGRPRKSKDDVNSRLMEIEEKETGRHRWVLKKPNHNFESRKGGQTKGAESGKEEEEKEKEG